MKMGDIIGSRDFDVYDSNKVKISKIQILISAPVEDVNKEKDWNCKYQILGIDGDKIKHTYGVDSLQALFLCIKKIEAELQYLQKANNIEFQWLGINSLGLGSINFDYI